MEKKHENINSYTPFVHPPDKHEYSSDKRLLPDPSSTQLPQSNVSRSWHLKDRICLLKILKSLTGDGGLGPRL